MFIKACLSFMLVILAYSKYEQEHKDHQFEPGGFITQISNDDFDQLTQFGKPTQSKPWFIIFYAHWCEHCKPLLEFWKEVANKYNSQINFGAVECHENEDIRDRIGISSFPQFVYFTKDNNMVKFIGWRTLANISDWIDHQRWRNQTDQFEDIPVSISQHNYFKRFLRRVFHPISLIIFLILFVLLVIGFCIFDKRQYARKMDEARKIKQELIRRKQENEFKTKFA